MDRTKDVPEWALEKAVSYINGCLSHGEMSTTAAKAAMYPSALAFAKYIAEHEEAPADPLLIEAREICATARTAWAEGFRSGRYDETSTEVPIALAALRRGIELTKAQQP